ncbi:SRPBCC family protein [Fulvivirga ulvae]|uniref:SRPBCC family protein n=1 Tax=Fulvivirga ulvae TaxID=2904245 RepID=UPI001F1B38BC|nr:SRPBCC family protein [Fulvivirga ulvae]UII31684.1 SRPBCC family protein [Fulvivirga ulvae]
MKNAKVEDSVQRSITIEVTQQKAFEVFVNQFGKWWPAEYTWSHEVLDFITIESGEGGRCFERGPNGFECDWGRVIRYEPPYAISFTWQIGVNREPVPDPAKASIVEVRFGVEDSFTRVEVHHHSFSRHGKHWQRYVAGMASVRGWSWLLDKYEASFDSI